MLHAGWCMLLHAGGGVGGGGGGAAAAAAAAVPVLCVRASACVCRGEREGGVEGAGRWVGAWVHGCVGAWVRGCVGAWVRGVVEVLNESSCNYVPTICTVNPPWLVQSGAIHNNDARRLAPLIHTACAQVCSSL